MWIACIQNKKIKEIAKKIAPQNISHSTDMIEHYLLVNSLYFSFIGCEIKDAAKIKANPIVHIHASPYQYSVLQTYTYSMLHPSLYSALGLNANNQ